MLHRVLGGTVPVSSTKPITGHTLGASGAIETALIVMALQEDTIPPTAGLRHQDPAIPLNGVHSTAQHAPLHAAAKTFPRLRRTPQGFARCRRRRGTVIFRSW
ncbi:hypothetical protein ACWDCC_43160 [Streptomyces sp. NPDC001102]